MFSNKRNVDIAKNAIDDAYTSDLKERLEEYESKVIGLLADLKIAKKQKEWELEKACNDVRKELEEKCFKADLARVDAEARLEAYESFDSKTDRDQAQAHLTILISGVADMLKNSPKAPDVHVHGK